MDKNTVVKVLEYIRDRIDERSTWVSAGTGVAGAAVLPHPWDYISFVIGLVVSMIPDKELPTQ